MTELLAKVFKKVSEELPEDEQDAFAEWLLKLIENDEREWDAQFAASADKLEKLADKALKEYARAHRGARLGQTLQALEPDFPNHKQFLGLLSGSPEGYSVARQQRLRAVS